MEKKSSGVRRQSFSIRQESKFKHTLLPIALIIFFYCRDRLYVTDIKGRIQFWENGKLETLTLDRSLEDVSIRAILPHGQKDLLLADQ